MYELKITVDNPAALRPAILNLAQAMIPGMTQIPPNDAAHEAAKAEVLAEVEKRRGPGRPRKTPESSAPVADAPAAAITPAVTPEPPAPQQAEVAAPASPATSPAEPVAAPLSDAPAITKEGLQTVLVAIAQSGPEGRNKVSALCQKYGAKNLSAIAPTNYHALYSEARLLLAEIRESQGS